MGRPAIHTENLITFTEFDPVTGLVRSGPFKFRINPDQLSVTKKKLEKYILTKIGYERQSWGNDLFQFQYSGSSGVFRPEETNAADAVPFDITTTRAWLKLKEFERFFERQGPGVVRMRLWAEPFEYVGSMPDFNFRQDAHNPFQIRYNFTFTGIPRDAVPVEIFTI